MLSRIYTMLASLLISTIAIIAGAQAEEEPIEIPVAINELPKDAWSKRRIVPSLDGGALVLRDMGNGPFNDASMWDINFNQELPFGRKQLSFDLTVGPAHKPLWGDKLLQPIINGVEADPALNDHGIASFTKTVSEDDGKGFIPVKSQSITLKMAASDLRLSTFAFMTAGAEGYDIKISNMKVVVWPQSDERSWPQRPHASTLGYRDDGSKTLYIEWHDDAESVSKTSAKITLKDMQTGQSENLTVRLPEKQIAISASRVSAVDLNHLGAGQYEITVPSFGKSTEETTIDFTIERDNRHFGQLRDEAWNAFYWITDGPDGPYPKAHPQDQVAIDFDMPTETKDVSGGWFDAGDYGKYSVNGSYSVSLMLITGLIAPDALTHNIGNVANGPANVADWLRVADNQLTWLYKMQRQDGAVYHKATTQKWPSLTATPEDDRAVKWLMPVTTTATANFAATMSLAAKIYLKQDDASYRTRGAEFQIAAKKALDWLSANTSVKMIQPSYNGDQYGGPYDDDDDRDERFFAYAAYAALTGDQNDISKALIMLENQKQIMAERAYDVNWRTVDLLGAWSLATSDQLDAKARKAVRGVLNNASNHWRDVQANSSWGIPVADDDNLYWGSNSVFATIGWHWILWSHLSGEKRFIENAETQLHYLFGVNPLDKTYVTGEFKNSVKAPHFRPSASGRIDLPAGFISGGPNSSNLAGDPLTGAVSNQPPMRSYVDDVESYATNEVAINWQSAWALYTSLLAAKLP